VRACLRVVFLGKGMPLPAKHALIQARTATLSVTLLTSRPAMPVAEHFWLSQYLFEVFEVQHHSLRMAWGLRLPGSFVFTGDTRPIPLVLQHYAAENEIVFHDCVLKANPSHTGVHELEQFYCPDIRQRLVLYHYESQLAAERMRVKGYRVAHFGEVFDLPDPQTTNDWRNSA